MKEMVLKPSLFHLHKARPPLLLFHRLISSSSSDAPHQIQQTHDSIHHQQQNLITATLNLINSTSPLTIIGDNDNIIPFSSDPSLLDRLLKRARFSHSHPIRTLEFFSTVINHSSSSSIPSSFSFNTMLYILGRSRKFQHSWSLLLLMRRLDPSLLSPSALQVVLARLAKCCSLRHTVQSFHKLRRLVRPSDDTRCFNALLRAVVQEKSMADARTAYHSLKHQFRPDLMTFNILLSGWKSVEDAESFFDEMRQLNVKPDLVTYNCLVDVYCKNRQVKKAQEVFDRMREEEEGIEPDVISYTSLIGGLGLIGQPDKARGLLKEMREAGVYPDVAAYNAAIRNYCIAKRLGSALAVMEEMRREGGLSPNATSYNLFFRVYYWANDVRSAWRMYRRMMGEGCLPNVQSSMFLVRLCRRNGKVELGLELWGDMVEKGFGALTLASDVLFDMLCDWGKLEEAEKCFAEMVEKGQKPSNVSFRRIKVLMELANKQESLRNLSEKMAAFGSSHSDAVMVNTDEEREQGISDHTTAMTARQV